MPSVTVRTRLRHLAPAALLALLLGGCAAQDPASVATTTSAAPAAPSAGHDAGGAAGEVAEPPVGLATLDARGRVSHLDLRDGAVTDLGAVAAPTSTATDGRYLFSSGADGLDIIDSGRWTWNHVDHFHYYLAEPRALGTVEGAGPAAVATTLSSTSGGTGVFFEGSGEAVLLDTAALSRGEIVERFRLQTDPHAGLVVPVGPFALVTDPAGGVAASVTVVDGDGMPVPGATAGCAAARGTITTAVGAVIGCADGVLLATVRDGSIEFERIPYAPGTTAPRAESFAGRDGRPTVAGIAGESGIWMLDTRERSLALRPTEVPLLAVAAVSDDAERVVGLSREGRVLVIEGATGATIAQTEPLVAESVTAGAGSPTLVIDQHRAYLNGPREHALFEIEIADAVRVARVFDTGAEPAFMTGTGR